jgi:hypothetical protein
VQFPLNSTAERLALCGGYAVLAMAAFIVNRRHLAATLIAPFGLTPADGAQCRETLSERTAVLA